MTFLSVDRVTTAAEIQGRAFFDDPLFAYVFPDLSERRNALPWLMGVGLRYGISFGEVHTNAGEMRAHAVWLPPGRTDVDQDGMHVSGFGDAPSVMSAASITRFGAFLEQVGPVHAQLMPDPHWYLMILGVDPPHQGKGIGGAMMQSVLARADADRLPCYLETAQERNVGFYRRFGFEVVNEHWIGDDGPRVWMMTRRPR
ncbi:MAG TPA: GNAT family N-acetyltransferase [Actinomycetota bacterium]|nr:GNAT family N-acetyltransferase [Actinomycetota bacterium]